MSDYRKKHTFVKHLNYSAKQWAIIAKGVAQLMLEEEGDQYELNVEDKTRSRLTRIGRIFLD